MDENVILTNFHNYNIKSAQNNFTSAVPDLHIPKGVINVECDY
jgi:hypothetical protein